jgi:hypothetical protein
MGSARVDIKIGNYKSIADLFKGLPKGVKKQNTWQKFWRLNTKPFIEAAQKNAPVSKAPHKFKFKGGEKTIESGTLRNSIGYFSTRKRRKNWLGGYVGPRVKGRFKNENAGFYGAFVEYGDEVMHFGQANDYAGKKFMLPAFESKKNMVLQNSMRDAEKIFLRETKRWAKRTKQFGILGR